MVAGLYCPLTEQAVQRFQDARGLLANGECDEHTWHALVEATWRLGDRLLFLTSPNLRGDDVSELQSHLGRLGFDCGRVDGILGPRTAQALHDFQANCGLSADGICGAETVRAILRVSSQTGDGPGVGVVREHERLREGLGTLATCRLVVGQFGGLSPLTRLLARELRVRGARVMSLDEPDAVAQALAANHFGADAYLGFDASATSGSSVHFYEVPTYHSPRGRALAEFVAAHLGRHLGEPAPVVSGMRLPVLRETRMPAVLAVLGPVRTVHDRVALLAHGVVDALELWISRAT